MKTYNFIVLGQPIAQARATPFFKDGRYMGKFDPKRSKNWKSDVRAQVAMQKPEVIDGPIAMSLHFMLPRPKGHFGTGRNGNALRPSAPKHHVTKPDADNLAKAIKDSLRGICYKDDCQIVSLVVTKEYGLQTTGVNIELTEVPC